MMADGGTTAIRGEWVLALRADGPEMLRDRWVVVERDKIAAITTDRPAGADHVIEGTEMLVLPGFLNLHNHTMSAVPFRGLTEDMPTEAFASELVYGLLMPFGDLLSETLSEAEVGAIFRLGLLELVKGGTTTLMDMFRNSQTVNIEVAEAMGLRFYAAPYMFSTSRLDLGPGGVPVYESGGTDISDLERCLELFRRHDGTAEDRIRVALGPHGPDSCTPDLLRAVREAADELGCPINTHMAQSRAEIALLDERYGKSPAECFEDAGLLGPDLLVAHCIFASDDDLGRLKRHRATVVNCPRTFSRGGVWAPFERFQSHGLRTLVATDGYCMDMVTELGAAGMISKLHSGRSDAATAWDLVRAVTLDAAEAIRRDDLGRIAPGARADLLVVDLAKPHLQPISDPIRTLVWNGRGTDITALMVDGCLLVEGGRFLLADEGAIMGEGVAAVKKLWHTEEAQAIIARAREA
jgi:cytosine/adenosine deaminase-related metal-dependent hydrolase